MFTSIDTEARNGLGFWSSWYSRKRLAMLAQARRSRYPASEVYANALALGLAC